MQGSVPLLVVVNGHVAAGKTTLARPLATALRLPLLARDDVKEVLYDTLGIGDREWSRRLGRASYSLLFAWAAELLAVGTPLVVEANFPRATEREFARLPSHRPVQVYCSAPRQLIEERFDRRERHAGHRDVDARAEALARLDDAEWEPLDLDGPLLRVDTSAPVDAAGLAARIEAA